MLLVFAVYGAPGVLWLVLVYKFVESAACACAKSSSACCFFSRLSRFKDLVYLLYCMMDCQAASGQCRFRRADLNWSAGVSWEVHLTLNSLPCRLSLAARILRL